MDFFQANDLLAPVTYAIPTLACLFSTLTTRDGARRYDGYQVFRVNITNEPAVDTMTRLFLNDNFDFWIRPNMRTPTDIMVCPEQVENFKLILGLVGVPYEIMIKDLKRTIDNEKVVLWTKQSTTFNWETYHRLDVIQEWMQALALENPSLVSVLSIGKSGEGKDMKLLKISTGGENKPAIWIDGGIHAREWISPAVVTFMANELVKRQSKRADYPLLQYFDWYFLPNGNPDGYEYSHAMDRMWRKTRSMQDTFISNLFRCKGTDPNRNFAYKWGGKGTSNNPCSDIYRGPSPASEPEIASVQKFVYDNKDTIKLFLTFHSYSQMLFLPWGYDNVRVDDYDDLMAVANKAAQALENVYGTKYDVGPSPELLYAAAGGSEDFAKGVAGIKYSYCFELRDTGKYGFLLPPDQIKPSGIETFAAVESMAEDMIAIYKLNETSPEPAPTSTTVSGGGRYRE